MQLAQRPVCVPLVRSRGQSGEHARRGLFHLRSVDPILVGPPATEEKNSRCRAASRALVGRDFRPKGAEGSHTRARTDHDDWNVLAGEAQRGAACANKDFLAGTKARAEPLGADALAERGGARRRLRALWQGAARDELEHGGGEGRRHRPGDQGGADVDAAGCRSRRRGNGVGSRALPGAIEEKGAEVQRLMRPEQRRPELRLCPSKVLVLQHVP
mmetsp:Transcript_129447/g.374890  ORF Transcript_129447/g.374890 Transcript_129447/m.374890 type:complete len:215 (-) Transcript_129447:1037-1681(-)